MNIILPLGGKGSRFSKENYIYPKPLIKIFDKCMIEYVIDNLSYSEYDNLFIIYNKNLDKFNFNFFIKNKYPFINLIKINDTKGAVETLYLGLTEILENKLTLNKKCLILDCDTFYKEDIRDIFNNSYENLVFYKKDINEEPIYSYINLDNYSLITNIKEKNKISNNANTGAYAFNDINILYDYCKFVLDNNITFNNEPYTSCVISEMLKENIVFKGYELNTNKVFSLGTPKELDEFKDRTYAFLFDLDGTLVITDDIYFEIWKKILYNFNIILTDDIFKNYIQGNNDKYVLNTLLFNANITLNDLSKLKDDLFIENINKIKVIEGYYDFINEIKQLGHKIAIITNCNKRIAVEIIKHIDIEHLIDFIISSDDCINGKPDIEPYKKAIEKLNISNNKCIIFEDSKSGILSAKNINPKLLIGLETIYNNKELINNGVNLSIKNFCNLNINTLIDYKLDKLDYLKNLIKSNSYIKNIVDIDINYNKLKGGFIADVLDFKIITDKNYYSLILKHENKELNNLSIMAKNIELYEREYYFYTDISNKISEVINIPKFYNLIVDENNNNIGIVLENLYEKKYKPNLNLNIENIDLTLKIVDKMAKMHSLFWNKNLLTLFPKLKKSNDKIFKPFYNDFIIDKYPLFKNKWFKNLNDNQQKICDKIYNNFNNIQNIFSIGNNLTFIHGDIKSPNIFFDTDEPYFIDWQHCAIGKGVQDLVFFIIESFDIKNIKHIYNLLKYYYYTKLFEYGVKNYSFKEYELDLYDAVCYIPFFTSIWFGTTPQDELIDKNFPYFFINKMFYLLELINE